MTSFHASCVDTPHKEGLLIQRLLSYTVAIDVPKGKSEEYKTKAARLGLSLSMLIQHSVEGYGEGGEIIQPKPKSENLSTEQKKLIEDFSKLPVDTQKAFMKVFRTIVETKGGGHDD